MAITISGENNNDRILAQDGVIDEISGINIVGLLTAGHINVGSNIQLGNAGIITATTFVGNLTGNVNSTSPLLLQTGGSERFRITGDNALGIAGANYGSSGQVLTSGGSGSAVTWSAIPTQVTIANNADNRVITGGSGVNLNGESTLTYGSNGVLNLMGASGNTQLALFRTNANTTGTAGIIGFYASDNHAIASMYALGDGDNEGAHLVFSTTSAASGSNPYSNVTERLRITSAGVVQVGKDNQSSTTFTQNLDIRGRYVNAVGDFSRLMFRNSTDSGNSSASIRAQRTGDNYGTELSFFTQASGLGSGGDGLERLRINSAGRLVVNHTQTSTPLDDTFLSIYDANSDSSAITPSGVSKNYAMISLHNYGTGAVTDTTGIGFGAGAAFSYTKGSIAFARSGSYGTGDLVFLTNNDQNTTMVNDTDEKLRITRDSKIIFSDCDVSIGRDAALANYADGSTTPTQLAVVKDGGGAGSGYHEVAHFTGGTDSNDTGAIVRITQFNNDRGMFIKAGRGTSDQAKAIIGLRNSGASDDNWLTLIQNTDQINIHKNVDIDNGVNLSIGGITGHAPLHVRSENTSYGKNAIFGASGWVNHANYHYTDATITLLGRDLDGNDKGTGIEMTVRNTANSNWLHSALTMDQSGHIRIFAGGAGTTVGTEKLQIDNVGNLKQGTNTPNAFTGGAPSHTQRFLGKKCMQGSVTSVTTLAANGTGTFDLGRLWITDDSSTELFIQVMRNDSTLYQAHYCKAFIQKVRGSGMTQGHILYQNGAASGYSVTGIQAGGYTASGGSSHGTQITVSGGAGGVIYRMVCFYTTLSKNDMY